MKRLLLILLLISTVGCGTDKLRITSEHVNIEYSQPIKKISVVDFAGEGGQAIADMMAMQLFRAGYNVVEREKLSDIILEQEIGLKGYQELSDLEKAKRFGAILNADVVITGRVVRKIIPLYYRIDNDHLGYQYGVLQLTARAVDTKTGKIIWIGLVGTTLSAGRGEYLKVLDYIQETTAELVDSFRNDNYKNKLNQEYEDGGIDVLRSLRKTRKKYGTKE